MEVSQAPAYYATILSPHEPLEALSGVNNIDFTNNKKTECSLKFLCAFSLSFNVFITSGSQ